MDAMAKFLNSPPRQPELKRVEPKEPKGEISVALAPIVKKSPAQDPPKDSDPFSKLTLSVPPQIETIVFSTTKDTDNPRNTLRLDKQYIYYSNNTAPKIFLLYLTLLPAPLAIGSTFEFHDTSGGSTIITGQGVNFVGGTSKGNKLQTRDGEVYYMSVKSNSGSNMVLSIDSVSTQGGSAPVVSDLKDVISNKPPIDLPQTIVFTVSKDTDSPKNTLKLDKQYIYYSNNTAPDVFVLYLTLRSGILPVGGTFEFHDTSGGVTLIQGEGITFKGLVAGGGTPTLQTSDGDILYMSVVSNDGASMVLSINDAVNGRGGQPYVPQQDIDPNKNDKSILSLFDYIINLIHVFGEISEQIAGLAFDIFPYLMLWAITRKIYNPLIKF